MMNRSLTRTATLGVALVAGATTASAQLAWLDADAIPNTRGGFSSGPDVVLQNLTDVDTFGPSGGSVAYIGDSYTCNIGDQNLGFGFSWNGSPGLAFNMYRLHEGRMMQVGQSWVKHACCAIQANGCNLGCSSGSGLGPGCRDIYSAGWNASQSRLGPRSSINAWTGNIPGDQGVGGGVLGGRLVVDQNDMLQEGSGAAYYMEGVYVGVDDAPAGNSYNNATYRRVTVNETTFGVSPTGATVIGEPAITAWTGADVQTVDIPGEGRFYVASQATDNGDGTYRYDYAIYNLNSDRAAGSFSVPLPSGLEATDVGFHDVDYHSGEIYDNTDWTSGSGSGALTWSSPQTFAQNPNSNAIRWGTMYNFWFDAAAAPEDGVATIGIFKTGSPSSVTVNVSVPGVAGCNEADLAEPFGELNFSDVTAFLVAFSNMEASADIAAPFGQWDFSDVTAFLGAFGAGCP